MRSKLERERAQLTEEKAKHDAELKQLQAALSVAVKDREREEGQKQAAEQHVASNASEIRKLREEIQREELKAAAAQEQLNEKDEIIAELRHELLNFSRNSIEPSPPPKEYECACDDVRVGRRQ